MTPDSPIWQLLLPMALLGIGNAFMWAPLATTATRNLPMHQAGAGAGVYNTTRQVGAVLGSAAIAALMESRLAAQGLTFEPSGRAAATYRPRCSSRSPTPWRSRCCSRPRLVLGFLAAISFARPVHQVRTANAPCGGARSGANPRRSPCNAELLTLNMRCTPYSATVTPRYRGVRLSVASRRSSARPSVGPRTRPDGVEVLTETGARDVVLPSSPLLELVPVPNNSSQILATFPAPRRTPLAHACAPPRGFRRRVDGHTSLVHTAILQPAVELEEVTADSYVGPRDTVADAHRELCVWHADAELDEEQSQQRLARVSAPWSARSIGLVSASIPANTTS